MTELMRRHEDDHGINFAKEVLCHIPICVPLRSLFPSFLALEKAVKATHRSFGPVLIRHGMHGLEIFGTGGGQSTSSSASLAL